MKHIAGLLAALVITATLHASDPATVKLRALELKDITVQASDPAGKTVDVPVHYLDLVRQVLLSPPPQGNTTDEQVKSWEAWEPIKKAVDAGQHRILLPDADYQFLLTRLNAFHWGGTPELQGPIATFIKYIRGLKEEDFPVSDPKK
jgi:hypothetical protein